MIKKLFLILVVLLAFLNGSIQAQSIFGINYNAIMRKGNLDYKKGKFDDALLKYNKVFKDKQNDPLLNYNLGTILYKKGNYDTASYFFDNAIKNINGNNKLKSKAYYNLGNSYMQQQKYDKATEAFSNSLKHNPLDEDSRYNLSYALRKLKKQQQEQNKQQNNKNGNPPPQTEKKDNKLNQNKAQELIKSLNNKEQEHNKKIQGQGNNTKAKDW